MTWRAYEADTLPFHCPCCRAITDRQVWQPITLLISLISPDECVELMNQSPKGGWERIVVLLPGEMEVAFLL